MKHNTHVNGINLVILGELVLLNVDEAKTIWSELNEIFGTAHHHYVHHVCKKEQEDSDSDFDA